MLLYIFAVLIGFALLIWSADKFVEGAASTADHLGVPTLLIGVLVVGFGTSAPEMVVSAIAAIEGSPALALGNALGSNIVNIALILGVTAIIAPIAVHSKIVRKEMPLLLFISLIAGYFLWDNALTFAEGLMFLSGFFVLVGWSIFSAIKSKRDTLADQVAVEIKEDNMSLNQAFFWLVIGLLLLVGSSRMLVWGAVGIANAFGVSDLIIGLTIVALGTSLPELAASVVAARKGEHDIAIGNIVGSNMFNILAVMGIATVIHPMNAISPEVFYRDWSVMLFLTIALFVMAYGFRGKQESISRLNGVFLLVCYIAYTGYLTYSL